MEVRNKSAEKSMVQLGFKPEIKLTSHFTVSYSYYFEGFSNNQVSPQQSGLTSELFQTELEHT